MDLDQWKPIKRDFNMAQKVFTLSGHKPNILAMLYAEGVTPKKAEQIQEYLYKEFDNFMDGVAATIKRAVRHNTREARKYYDDERKKLRRDYEIKAAKLETEKIFFDKRIVATLKLKNTKSGVHA